MCIGKGDGGGGREGKVEYCFDVISVVDLVVVLLLSCVFVYVYQCLFGLVFFE